MIPRTIKSTNSNQQMPMRSIVHVLVVFAIACPGVLVQSFQSSLPRSQPSFVNVDTRRHYSSAGAMDIPLSSSDPSAANAANFEERMRHLVQNTNGSKQQPKKASSTASMMSVQSPLSAPHVIQVSTLQEYKQVVVDDASDATDQVTAVRFYAPWCRSCHAIQGHFYRLGRVQDGENESKLPNVKFVQVAVGPENAALHQGLGVQSLPYAHIYHKTAGLVEELRMNKKRFGDFEQILQSYNDGACVLPETVDALSGVYEAPYERS